jgi:aryl-alcohol dehydrogenase-like predicted oxidoreductase
MVEAINQIGFGGASLTSLFSLRESLRLLNQAFDSGITHFDTAPLYGRGYSEIILGKFAREKRTKISITTKFGLGGFSDTRFPISLAMPLNYLKKKLLKSVDQKLEIGGHLIEIPKRLITKQEVENSFKLSISRLKTDFLDYYLLHEGIPFMLTDEAQQFLLLLIQKGWVKKIGLATNSNIIRSLDANCLTNWSVLQYEFNEYYEDSLIEKHPDKLHIHHSCLKNLSSSKQEHVYLNAGDILALAAKQNPCGKILFSTRRINVLKSNVDKFQQKFSNNALL